MYLAQEAIARTWLGDLAGAEALVTEADAVATATGSRLAEGTALRLRALRGVEAEAAEPIQRAIEAAESDGGGNVAAWAYWAAAVLYNGLCRYADAMSAARSAADNPFDPWNSMWALPELVEAATRAGDDVLALEAVERLVEMTQPCDSDAARGIEARSRALVSRGEEAGDLYREAIDRLTQTGLRPDLARTHLLYGEWLRREGQRVSARQHLRTAYEMLDSIGMHGFAERARRELLATGEKARKRRDDTRDDLTPQEEQIARLARDGHSNPEIGALLFLSPRTVEWHLRKVFTKLQISSRSGLRTAMPRHDREATPA
jgi:DNA-binding CsgD family transcriptional regulator